MTKPWQEALISGLPFIDVRAPIEYLQGHAPNALNLPILNDEERHQVGLTYKTQGPEAATRLGHEMVSGHIKDARIEQWQHHIRTFPSTWLYCARGGQRSQIAERWISEAGLQVQRVSGGYKQVRQFLIQQIEVLPEKLEFNILTGMTGSGKTELLRRAFPSDSPSLIDLELLAQHRGSAFGPTREAQPTQAQFENELALQLSKSHQTQANIVWLEDESRSIGRVVIPKSLFEIVMKSPLYLVEEPLEQRALRIFDEYIVSALREMNDYPGEAAMTRLHERLTNHLAKIGPKLGGALLKKSQGLLSEAIATSDSQMAKDKHLEWIQILLKDYYDPFYQHHIEKNKDRIRWQGTYQEALSLLV